MKKITQIKKSTSQSDIKSISKTESQKVPYRVNNYHLKYS
jgi:hypothetical protein